MQISNEHSMMNQRISALLLGLAICLSACQKDLPGIYEPETTNGALGTVEDHSQLEAGTCGDNGLMLALDNGMLLDVRHDFGALNWGDGDRVRAQFEPLYLATTCQRGTPAYLYELEAEEGIKHSTLVRAGTYFDISTADCISEWTLMQGYMNLEASTCGASNAPLEPCTFSLSDADWTRIEAAVQQSDFAGAPDTIGCPNCFGQGGEWVEIEQNGEIQRVVFEYNANNLPIQELVDVVRDIREQAGSCPN